MGTIHNCLSLVVEFLDPTSVTSFLDILTKLSAQRMKPTGSEMPLHTDFLQKRQGTGTGEEARNPIIYNITRCFAGKNDSFTKQIQV